MKTVGTQIAAFFAAGCLVCGCGKGTGSAQSDGQANNPGLPQVESRLPFPGYKDPGHDSRIAELVAYRIKKHNDPDGDDTHKKLVAMGSPIVPTLIHLSKVAANRDPRVLHPEEHDDYGWELRRPIQILVDIGDRRAIPLLCALVKYDHPKPMRILQNLAELLCHGSDEQIRADATAKDSNLSRAAKMVLRDPQTFEYTKRKYRESNKRINSDQ